MNPEVRRELERLLSGLCDGQLSETEHARLEELLEADAECRRLYLEYVDLHAGLLMHAPSAAEPSRRVQPSADGVLRLANRGKRMAALRYVLVAAGTLAASLLVQWFLVPPRGGESAPRSTASPSAGYVATLVQASDCIWEGAGQPPAVGVRLSPGELLLLKGIARIRADGGAALTIEGPAVLRLDSGTAATVLSGQVVFQADETAAPSICTRQPRRWWTWAPSTPWPSGRRVRRSTFSMAKCGERRSPGRAKARRSS